MGAVSSENSEVIDLTSTEEAPRARESETQSQHSGGRKRRLYVSLLDDAEDTDAAQSSSDPEVVYQSAPSPPRPLNPTDPAAITRDRDAAKRRRQLQSARHRRASVRHDDHVDDLVVVSERQLTPQERLREIQEQHKQGKTVNPRQAANRGHSHGGSGMPGSNAAMLYTQHLLGGPLGPIHGRLIVPPRPHRHYPPRPRIWHSQIPLSGLMPLPGLPLPNFETLEQRDLEQTLLMSMEDTTRRRQLDRDKLLLPRPPSPAREGFTRSLAVLEPLVCIKCERELGQSNPDLEEGLSAETKLNHNKMFVRGCGHVYCGRCTYSMKLLPPTERACLRDCTKNVPARKRRIFREVFT